jgi:hypothetical protein
LSVREGSSPMLRLLAKPEERTIRV